MAAELVAMGFERGRAEQALALADGDPEQAVALLLDWAPEEASTSVSPDATPWRAGATWQQGQRSGGPQDDLDFAREFAWEEPPVPAPAPAPGCGSDEGSSLALAQALQAQDVERTKVRDRGEQLQSTQAQELLDAWAPEFSAWDAGEEDLGPSAPHPLSPPRRHDDSRRTPRGGCELEEGDEYLGLSLDRDGWDPIRRAKSSSLMLGGHTSSPEEIGAGQAGGGPAAGPVPPLGKAQLRNRKKHARRQEARAEAGRAASADVPVLVWLRADLRLGAALSDLSPARPPCATRGDIS
jgi:hypothetical protein